jgi:hypothetical protein
MLTRDAERPLSNRMSYQHPQDAVRRFFARSDWLDRMVLRPLSHIAPNWEVGWDDEGNHYRLEPFSFAADLNEVIGLIATCPWPLKYHHHEDALAERVVRNLKWPIQKKGNRWVGADYEAILEQGAFRDLDQKNLIAAAAGRVHAALDYAQSHFDEMEDGHLYMLSALVAIIIYHRHASGESLLVDSDGNNIP